MTRPTSPPADVGISLYGHGAVDTVELAVAAERFGLSSVWLGEHITVPMSPSTAHPYRSRDDPPILGPESRLLDLFTTVGAVAARTTRLRIATGIYVLPLRPPVLTALGALTAHEISGGRFVLGVGSGWVPEEFAAVGVNFATRGAVMDECIDVIRAALAGGTFRHAGTHLPLPQMQLTRQPAAVPIVVGGTSARALRRAATRGDGWYNPSTGDLEECTAVRHRIDDLRREAGTTDRSFSYHIRVPGDIDRAVANRYRAAGFKTLCASGHDVWPSRLRLSLDDKLERLEAMSRRTIE